MVIEYNELKYSTKYNNNLSLQEEYLQPQRGQGKPKKGRKCLLVDYTSRIDHYSYKASGHLVNEHYRNIQVSFFK